MENETRPPFLTELVEKNIQVIRKAELISVFVVLIGLIVHFMRLNNLDFVLIIGAVATAIVYFLNAYSIEDASNVETTGILNSFGFILFIYKLTFFSLAIAAVTLLMFVTDFPFVGTLINISGMTLIITFTISLITKINDRSKIYNTTFYLRVVPTLIMLFYLASIHYNWLKS